MLVGPRRRVAAGREPGREPAELVGRRPWFGDQPVEERTSRAHDDQAAEQGDLGPELIGLRRHQERAGHATRRPNTTRPTRPAGTVFGSVIMKNRKISTSGEVTITRQ